MTGAAGLLRLGSEPGITLELLTLGAAIHRLELTGADGERRNVVLGHAELDDYRTSGLYLGATVGRYANRIAGGRFTLNGREYQLPLNERGHNLHGGPDGFDQQIWDVVRSGPGHAVLELVSLAGDQGFPGSLTATAHFSLGDDTLRIVYTASTDAPTLVSLSSHVYWNLNGEGSGTIDEHLLTVHADRFTPVDGESIPLGEHADVAGTPFDFRQPRRLGTAIRADHPQIRAAHGIDHNFVISGEGMREAAVLRSPGSGLELTLRTDQPGLQVYTGNFLDGSHRSSSGGLYRQGAGIAMEPQHFPDSPHHEGESGWPSTVLRPGEIYRTEMQMRIQAL